MVDSLIGQKVPEDILKDLRKWHGKVPNVNGYSKVFHEELRGGQGTGIHAIRIYVTKKKALSELKEEEILPEVHKYHNVDVVEIGELKALDTVDPKAKIRPVIAGISVGHYLITAGTIGWFAKDNTSGNVGILSNNHVLANENICLIGDPILQPGVYDGGTSGDKVASLTRYVPIQFGGNTGGIFSGFLNFVAYIIQAIVHFFTHGFSASAQAATNNIVDCAFAEIDSSVGYTPIINGGVAAPTGTNTANVGDAVTKSGRTTGVTVGTIADINATVSVSYGRGGATYDDQIIINNQNGPLGAPFSQPGDSGSLIISNGKAVGLLFAGSSQTTIANHIENVLSALKITLL
jgi:hypothetical protein